MNDSAAPRTLDQRLVDGLERLGVALQTERRRFAEAAGLNATQAAILRLLHAYHPGGLRVGQVAEHLGVRQPTATDSLNALERRGLVTRQPDEDDARAKVVALTRPPTGELSAAGATHQALLSALSEEERVQFLRLVIKLIRRLQQQGAIPAQRLCVSCRYFRPDAHPGSATPHHCALVDAPFADGELRLDCAEHEPAEAPTQAGAWNVLRARGF